jgi:AcrR family transcriptional regulator
VDRACGLFARSGFRDVSMREIAGECGVTEAALYRHFPSKEQIWSAVVGSLHDRIDIPAALARIGRQRTVRGLLTATAGAILRFHRHQPEVPRVLLHCSLARHSAAATAYRELRLPFIRALTQRLEALARSGEINPVNPEITARCFVGMVFDCALCLELWRQAQGRRYKPEAVIRNNVSVYVWGLAPRSQAVRRTATGRVAKKRTQQKSRRT